MKIHSSLCSWFQVWCGTAGAQTLPASLVNPCLVIRPVSPHTPESWGFQLKGGSATVRATYSLSPEPVLLHHLWWRRNVAVRRPVSAKHPTWHQSCRSGSQREQRLYSRGLPQQVKQSRETLSLKIKLSGLANSVDANSLNAALRGGEVPSSVRKRWPALKRAHGGPCAILRVVVERHLIPRPEH